VKYETGIVCPRCGRPSHARAEEDADGKGVRLVMCRCVYKECTYYARTWFFAIDDTNEVLYHTLYDT
jgi:hypothetical protein